MFKSLSYFQKFQTGSSLWLIFFEPQRQLFKQINWRTGFLLSGLKTGKPPSWPILLGTQKIFPNLWLVCLPLKKESWSADIYKCWENMSKPSLRVFIPLSYNEEPLNKLWTKTPVYDLSFYKEVLK